MSNAYKAPLADIGFVIDELAGLGAIAACPGFAAWDSATAQALLASGARFYEDVWAPSNRPADVSGARLVGGTVETHPALDDIYRQTMAGGWNVLPRAPGLGGEAVPWLIHAVFLELAASGNGSFALLTGLIAGASELLRAHASPDQLERYVSKLESGEWAGAMDLSEPGAGSDLGALTTRALPQPDGTYRLFGTKRYISWGDHEITRNIVHLVLARTPDAPPGTAGISCFIVPKYLVDDLGRIGARNDIRAFAVEQNMGFRASPTCVMTLGDEGGAMGYLVGAENAGMRIMFTMLNSNRLATALGALGISERARQAALAAAKMRVQGVPPGAPAGSAIVAHADVRRMLMTQRALCEAMRAICYCTAAAFDLAAHAADEATRVRHQQRANLLTPVAKAWCTDMGIEVTSLAIQLLGGAGFVEDSGVAQHFRDIRIMSIFEGTNGIQAQDLVGRKLGQAGGETVAALLAEIAALAASLNDDAALAPLGTALAGAVAKLREATAWMLAEGNGRSPAALAGASAYMRLFGGVLAGFMLARSAQAAKAEQATHGADFAAGKVATARFYCEQLLPYALAASGPAMAGPEAHFGIAEGAL
ncbi:MAG: acyl-CoA dehydrogenase [Proteobacteria bacterium]|nr:acyl-CoA dehydrogenase [Pseudomonadota bacterium]